MSHRPPVLLRKLLRVLLPALLRVTGRVLAAVLWCVVVVQLLLTLLPGDTADLLAGPAADPARIAALRAELGLDRPVAIQLLDRLAALLQGDLGTSLVTGRPVGDLLAERLRVTAVVAVPAWLLALIVGSGAAVTAALRPRTPAARAVRGVAAVVSGVPDAVLVAGLVAVLAGVLAWLPPVVLLPVGGSVLSAGPVLWLPLLALVVPATGWVVRSLQGPAADVAGRRHVAAALDRGHGAVAVAIRHVLPALAPAVGQVAALLVGGLLAGAVVVERLLAFPGAGDLLAQSVTGRDVPVVQGFAMVLAGFTAAGLAVADLLARWATRAVAR